MKSLIREHIDMSGFESATAYQSAISAIVDNTRTKDKITYADSETLVGIEVEVEQILKRTGFVALDGTGYLWSNIEDGSLRNNGREFVSKPIKGSQITYAVKALFSYLNKDKQCLGYEFTDRTSIHIHLNYRDETIQTLANTMLLYILLEPLLYNFVGGDRFKNIFCVPMKESNKLYYLNRMFTSFEKGTHHWLDGLYDWTKYSGFNLQPLARYGTIEYRHMVGTDDVPKILSWINILLSIKEYASKADYTKLKSTLIAMNTTSEYLNILNEVLGLEFPYNELGNVEEMLEESTMFIKEIYAFDEKDYKILYVDKAPNLDTLFFSKYMKAGFIYNKKGKATIDVPIGWTVDPFARPATNAVDNPDLVARWTREMNTSRRFTGTPTAARNLADLIQPRPVVQDVDF